MGATRYGEFMERLPISNSVLTKRLRALTENGLLERTAYRTRPVRAEYLITQRGRALWPVLLSIWEWERRWVPDQVDRPSGHAPHGMRQRFRADAELSVMRRGGHRERGDGALGSQWLVAALGARGGYPSPVDGRQQPRSGRTISRDDERLRKPLGGGTVGVRLPGNQPLHRLSDTARGAAVAAGRQAADVLRQRCAVRVAPSRPGARPLPAHREGPGVLPGHRHRAAVWPALVSRTRRPGGAAHPYRLRQAVRRAIDLRPVRSAAERHAGQSSASGCRAATTPRPTSSTASRRPPRRHRRTGRRQPRPAASR